LHVKLLKTAKIYIYNLEWLHPFRDEDVIIGTRLEKPSKINGFALLGPNFFMPERERTEPPEQLIITIVYKV